MACLLRRAFHRAHLKELMSLFGIGRNPRRVASDNGVSRRSIRPAVGMCALMAAAFVHSIPAQAQATRVGLFALTDNNKLDYYSFKLRDRATRNRTLSVDRSKRIKGVPSGESLVGIDFRPANSQLYAISDGNVLYTIDLRTAVATRVSALTATLAGTNFGVDFNPVPDRLRVVSDAEQNLRINVDTGAVLSDTALAFAPTSANAGVNPNVTASAYTNSFAGATTTTLYGIDTNLNALVLQNPPNAGTLNTVGLLGFDVADVAGFDISSSNTLAFASLIPQGSSRANLYSIDLASGLSTFIGRFGSRGVVRDIALLPGQ